MKTFNSSDLLSSDSYIRIQALHHIESTNPDEKTLELLAEAARKDHIAAILLKRFTAGDSKTEPVEYLTEILNSSDSIDFPALFYFFTEHSCRICALCLIRF